ARFEHPKLLMSYVGLVPSEHSSRQTRRQGAITKSGSQHARRLLVEAAWHYRHPPRLATRLKARQVEQPAVVIAIAWKAQQRLHQTWRRLDPQRGKRRAHHSRDGCAGPAPGQAANGASESWDPHRTRPGRGPVAADDNFSATPGDRLFTRREQNVQQPATPFVLR
ncbi:MAG: transposase, partial [Solirubrobacteraceae bacterium]